MSNQSSTYVGVGVMDEVAKGRQYLLNRLNRRGRVLVATQVHDDPCDVAQERDRYRRVDEDEQRLDDAQTDDVVATLRTVT